MRTGVIAKKVGMTRLFQDDGRHVPVTVLALEGCRSSPAARKRDGYVAVQLGAGERQGEERRQAAARPFRQGRGRAEGEGRRVPRRPRTRCSTSAPRSPPSTSSPARWSTSRARPRARASPARMKRWGFGGMRATHGVSISHRALGSTGQRQDPGKVFKNKKMAGHMGDKQRTQQNLEVVRTDVARGLIFVKGSVPGSKGGWLIVHDAVKVPVTPTAPFPARPQGAAEAGGPRGAPMPAWSTTAAVHEIPALPSAEEVAAIAAEQEAGASGRRLTPSAEDCRRRRGRTPRATPAQPTRARRADREGQGSDPRRQGKAGGDIELNDAVFGVEPRADILHRVVTWQLENRRGTARADPRALRRRPHRQEVRPPEGRRHGSSRRPPRPDLHRRRQGARRPACATSSSR